MQLFFQYYDVICFLKFILFFALTDIMQISVLTFYYIPIHEILPNCVLKSVSI